MRTTYNPRRFVFPNGARITYAYLERDTDAEAYQGWSTTRVYIEEAGNFPSPAPILKLMATLRRIAGVPVGDAPDRQSWRRKRYQWLRSRYIDPAPLGWRVLRDATGLERIYIPSRVADNLYLGSDYVQRLQASGSPELVRAWLFGDWTVVGGAFFSEFSADRHIWRHARCPITGRGFARSTGARLGRSPCTGGPSVTATALRPDIARSCLVCYREWYGMKPGEPNVGLRMTAEQVAVGIRDGERDDPKPKDGGFVGVKADPAIFAEDGGPSIASRMTQAARIVFRPADNKRVPQRGARWAAGIRFAPGWSVMRTASPWSCSSRRRAMSFARCRRCSTTLPGPRISIRTRKITR